MRMRTRRRTPSSSRVDRCWGVWAIPEADVGALGDVRGLDVLELGCGAAHWSVALAPDAGSIVGLDQSQSQLHHGLRPSRTAVRACRWCAPAASSSH